ncbi:class II fructose-bisphosphate aldolase [Pseudomonadales bacterium]|nr:class II fructose-bisphosphate aldolase [Pseudomonadales bacterium]MDC0893256.1 class II fructose-bisphosphate aldolase [Pseudomonadales bacterium]
MALAAFNVFDFDGIRAVADAAGEVDLPVYIQFSASTVKYYGAEKVKDLLNLASGNNRQFVKVHLDHCNDLNLIKSCIENEWDSVMGDFSHLSLNENITNMLDIKALIGERFVEIEGELGQVAGVEDGHGKDGGSYVELEEVKRFVDETNVELLALGIGNAHGFYSSTDSIDINLLKKVHHEIPNQKLVLHGGTGIEPNKIRDMKRYGIYKINISTELKDVYLKASKLHLESDKKFEMVSLINNRYESVKNMAKQKILEFK